MDHVKVYGSFVKEGNHTFRKSAYLQWGNSEKSLGGFLLLNPGGAAPLQGEVKRDIIDEYETNMDMTMRQIVKLVERIYDTDKLNGRVQIYNLFTLRNAKAKEAIVLFEDLVKQGVINPSEGIISKDELKMHPWICCGWGINGEKRNIQLNMIKQLWMTALQNANVPFFGKPHKNKIDYYHIKPQIKPELFLDELYQFYMEMIG